MVSLAMPVVLGLSICSFSLSVISHFFFFIFLIPVEAYKIKATYWPFIETFCLHKLYTDSDDQFRITIPTYYIQEMVPAGLTGF